jgi:hypothetical protein
LIPNPPTEDAPRGPTTRPDAAAPATSRPCPRRRRERSSAVSPRLARLPRQRSSASPRQTTSPLPSGEGAPHRHDCLNCARGGVVLRSEGRKGAPRREAGVVPRMEELALTAAPWICSSSLAGAGVGSAAVLLAPASPPGARSPDMVAGHCSAASPPPHLAASAPASPPPVADRRPAPSRRRPGAPAPSRHRQELELLYRCREGGGTGRVGGGGCDARPAPARARCRRRRATRPVLRELELTGMRIPMAAAAPSCSAPPPPLSPTPPPVTP